MTMDSKGIIKCYEIKVTLSDLKSNAKKSWYGNYNYLVVTSELYDKIQDWNEYIPSTIGIIKAIINNNKVLFVGERKCKKIKIDDETSIMLKESMVRSMYWKMIKYKKADSIDERKKLEKKLKDANKNSDYYYNRALEAERTISDYENYYYLNNNEDIDLKTEAKKEKEKYYNNKKGIKNID